MPAYDAPKLVIYASVTCATGWKHERFVEREHKRILHETSKQRKYAGNLTRLCYCSGSPRGLCRVVVTPST